MFDQKDLLAQNQQPAPETPTQQDNGISELDGALKGALDTITNQDLDPLKEAAAAFRSTANDVVHSARGVAAEIFTPMADDGFSAFLEGSNTFASFIDQQEDVLPEIQQERQKEPMEQMISRLINEEMLRNANALSASQSNNFVAGELASYLYGSEQSKEKTLVGAVLANTMSNVAENVQDGVEERQKIQQTLARYTQALADNPAIIAELAASINEGTNVESVADALVARLVAQQRAEAAQKTTA